MRHPIRLIHGGCIVAGLLLGLCSLPAHGQVTWNIQAGINGSNLDASLESLEAEARLGGQFGFNLRIGNGFFYFNPGAYYTFFTADLIGDPTNVSPDDLEDESSIRQLKIPINAGVRLTREGGLLALHAFGGPVGNILLGVDENDDLNFDRDDLKSFTIGANLGLGVDIVELFTLDVAYEFGLTDFFATTDGRNNVFTINAGIKF